MANSFEVVNKMLSLSVSCLKTVIIRVAIKYDICDHLSKNAMNAKKLSEITKCDQHYLNRLLRSLVSLGVLKSDKNQNYSLTLLGQTLRTDSDICVKNYTKMFSTFYYDAYPGLEETIKNGKPAFDVVYGLPFYQFLSKNKEEYNVFSNGMIEVNKVFDKNLCTKIDFSKFKRIVDVGGGHGNLTRYILTENQSVSAIVFDKEEVIKDAEKTMNEQFGDRCKMVGGDFLVSVPGEGDCYLLQNVMWNWNDEDAVKIFKNIRKAMNADAKLLIIEPTINKELGILWDFMIMAQMCGIVRTVEEFDELLKKADMKVNQIIETENLFRDAIEVIPI